MNLEELVKSLNERCKTYGLRAKPTTLLELPFGNCTNLFVFFVMILAFIWLSHLLKKIVSKIQLQCGVILCAEL